MSDSAIMVHVQLDTQGLYCPDPIMMLRKAIRQLQVGEVVEVVATDPSTSWDIPRFCVHMNHELLLQEQTLSEQQKKCYRYLIKKGA
ncbi:sulfurtransferase TusA [Acinetobacter sp. B5B]|uniref:sulfurtransferase TusA n=1 Tax=Acinetobacter baretiae TaxID=2605383 RepID=UPI0018C2B2C6|nr:sulfurtransferase TusA [Acinetobacter baretiae]MBF7682281.1 sulfurtransferase TusA [Acinetobacter baretiae]MBF7685109.1 sulfurtransferase TusA [Acinetobacter baretiae]